jgi:hypothetical protein
MEIEEERRFAVGRDFIAKAAKRLRGYLIRLTREYTDGGMDSRAEETKGMQKKKRNVYCCHQDQNLYSAQMFAPPSMYPWVRRA